MSETLRIYKSYDIKSHTFVPIGEMPIPRVEMSKEVAAETAQAFGATTRQYVFKFLYVEARSSLIIGFTTAFVSFISYSTIMGAIGGGGIGDFAIRYGYHRYETDIMIVTIIILVILVQILQAFGMMLSKKLDRRHAQKWRSWLIKSQINSYKS